MSINFENRFWLQILGDHVRFFEMTLASKETQLIQETQRLKLVLDTLLNEARRERANSPKIETILRTVEEVKELKKTILAGLLEGKVDINLPPTFINHMLNEIQMYEKILTSFRDTGSFENHVLETHYLWNSDAAGHAIAIVQTIDPVEKKLMKKLKKVHKTFEALFIKSLEMIGYFRSGLQDFPSIEKLNREVTDELIVFTEILNTIREERLTSELLGVINPLMVDHMIRESSYALQKIQEAEGRPISLPHDPTAPRIEKS